MKEFGLSYGPNTVGKMETLLETRQSFNDLPAAMLDPPSHTYAATHHRASQGFVQRMLYQQQVRDGRATARRQRDEMRTIRMLQGFPGPGRNGSRGSHCGQPGIATWHSTVPATTAVPAGRHPQQSSTAPGGASITAGTGSSSPARASPGSTTAGSNSTAAVYEYPSPPRRMQSGALSPTYSGGTFTAAAGGRGRRVADLVIPTANPAVHVHDEFVVPQRRPNEKQMHASTLRDGFVGDGSSLSPDNSATANASAHDVGCGVLDTASHQSETSSVAATVIATGSIHQGTTITSTNGATGLTMQLPRIRTFGGGYTRARSTEVAEELQAATAAEPGHSHKKGKTYAELVAARRPVDKRAMRKWTVKTPIDAPTNSRYR